VIFGVKTKWARDMLYAAHKGTFDLATTEDREVPVVITDFATAELVKTAANAFLATKISFINAMAEVCEAAGADVTQLSRAIGYDSRIGNKFLRAGIGFGGGCLPKDIRAFQARAQELGVGEALRFLHEVDLINQRRRQKVVEIAADLLRRPYGPAGPDLAGMKVAALGASFKPNTDDVRDSPALSVVRRLSRAGADVSVYDPEGMVNADREVPDVKYAKTLNDAVTGADLVCVLTAWDEFRYMDPATLSDMVSAPRIIDGMNCLDATQWVQAGWEYRGMGRAISPMSGIEG
jgi:UDPglucose 6-dehydrogenase